MGARRKPFWVLDCESDPFEPDTTAVVRRACPECAARAGKACVIKGKQVGRISTHEKRRRIPQPFIWGLYGGPTGDEYYEFDTAEEVVAFLRDREHLVYAHNGGKFDYHYMREHVNTCPPPSFWPKGEAQETISIISGRMARFRIGKCEFRDSMNILPVALKEFKKDDMDYSLMEPEARVIPANRVVIRKYLRSDCTNLFELISAHRQENGVTLTQAGASMKRWQAMSGMRAPRQSAHRYHDYKKYYYGGRVQCHAQGVRRKKFKLVDMNSAYPEAMLHAHPFSPAGIERDRLPPDGQLHKCLVTLDATARGCFPFRLGADPTKGDLYFPEDEKTVREYNITGYELMAAMERDAVKIFRIKEVHYFQHTVQFEEFIQTHWDKRTAAKLAGNKALDIIYKLLMNSLYGKFASDYSKYREHVIAHLDDVAEFQAAGFDIDPIVWAKGKRMLARKLSEDKARYYNIATAASITGYVRAKLFQAICEVDQPLYCDTDGLACVDTGSLQLGSGLGAWKLEGEFDEYAIAGKKTYAFHHAGKPRTLELDERDNYLYWKVASKGVDLDPLQIIDAARGKTILHSPMAPTYSVRRSEPIFVDRRVTMTARDIRIVPEEMPA